MIKIIGDVMLDVWVEGACDKISPEAPVIILKEKHKNCNVGGAGNLALNLSNLGTNTSLYGSVGKDTAGHKVIEILLQKNIKSYVCQDGTITTTKTRMVGTNGQHLLRLDREEFYHLNSPEELLLQNLQQQDTVLVSDYNKGVVKKNTVANIVNKGCKVFVDPKQSPDYYKGAYLVKPNMKEYESWFGAFNPTDAKLKCIQFQWDWLIVTDGANGIHIVSTEMYQRVTGNKVEVSDVSGAGDSVLAILAHYHQTKDIVNCCKLAVKGVEKLIQKRGVSVIAKHDVEDKIIWTNGVFDILHTGHLELLKFAKSQGDRLIVGINSDNSVKKLKGDSRPFNNALVRKQQLSQLPWVDKVVVFDDDTPIEQIKQYKPNIIVKGGDYTVDTVVGNQLAEVIIFPTVQGFSTTDMLKKIKQ